MNKWQPPEPDGYKFSAPVISKIDVWPHGGNWVKLYSEEKLLAVRREAIEECAQLMEKQDAQAPKHNAKAIRNLLKD